MYLKNIFYNLMSEYNITNKRFIDNEWEFISHSYSERKYHNLNHLSNLIKFLYEVEDYFTCDFNDVLLAGFYHDIFYEVNSSRNEVISANLMYTRLSGMVDPFSLMTAQDLITYLNGGYNVNGDLFLDSDYASGIALDYDVFVTTGDNIVAEYIEGSSFDKEEIIVGRKIFLKNLIDRESIFYSPHFKENYESLVRDNIEKFLNNG